MFLSMLEARLPAPKRWRQRASATAVRARDGSERSVLITEIGLKVAESGIRLILGFLVTAIVIRRLGPERFGAFTYIWSLYAIATAAAGLGLDQVLQRRITIGSESRRSTLRAIVVVRIGSSFVGAGALAAAAMAGAGQDIRVGLVIAGLGLVLGLAETFVILLQFTRGSAAVGRARLIAFVAGAVVRVAVVVVHPSLPAFVAATLIEPAVLWGLTAASLRHEESLRREESHRPVDQPRAGWRTYGELIREGIPFLASGLFVIVYMRIDVVLLKRWSTAHEVGVYGAATRLSELAYFIPVAVAGAAGPKLLATFAIEPMDALRAVHRLTAALAGFALAFIAATWCVGPLVLRAAFGSGFAGSGAVLQIHVFSCLGVFVGVMRESWFLATNRGHLTLLCTAGGALINVGLNAWLIPQQGARGAAIATAVAYGAAALVFPLLFPEGRQFLGLSRAIRRPRVA